MASSALIDDLLKQFAENPRRVFARLANEYRKRGELDTAIEICRAHVPLQPTYISGYIVLGQALYETGQLDEAHRTFETALGLDPENLIGLRQLGDIARAKGDMSGARGWYRRLLEVDPQNDEVEAVLREIDAPAAAAAAAPATGEPVSWNDINPEAMPVPAPVAAPPAATSEPPASKALDFDYDVLSAFGEAESKPSEQSAPAEAGRDEPAPVASQPEAVHAAPAPVVVPAPAPVEELESASDEPLPAAFITETMAELYLQQGHREQALDIYRLLLAQRPTDVSLLDRIARLQQATPAAPSERTVRAFFGRFANRHPPAVLPESEAAAQAAPMAADAPVSAEPAPSAYPELELSPVVDSEPAAWEEAPPLGREPRAESHAEPVEAEPTPSMPAVEPMALETADTWMMEPAPVRDVAAHSEAAAEPAPEREAMAAPAPMAEAAPAEEPSIAAFAPAETRVETHAEMHAEPEPEPVAPAPAPNESLEPPPHVEPVRVEPVRVGDYTPDHGRSMSFADLFAGREASQADEQAAEALASAYGTDAGVTNGAGNPTRAAADALSLDDVFGGGAHEHDSTPVTFDEFFSSQNAAHSEPAPESGTDQSPAPPVAERRADDADLELFHQWLEGLKK